MNKELEMLEKIVYLATTKDEKPDWLLSEIAEANMILKKELKALEIIKKKKVNVGCFIECCLSLSYEEYIKQWGNWHKHIFKNISEEVLTQQEFDVLKEALENGR